MNKWLFYALAILAVAATAFGLVVNQFDFASRVAVILAGVVIILNALLVKKPLLMVKIFFFIEGVLLLFLGILPWIPSV